MAELRRFLVILVVAVVCLLVLHAGVGKAQSDSCTNRCMEQYNASQSCYCDSACARYDNCCEDYISVCLPNSTIKCYGRCFDVYGFISDATCYCDDECSKYGNCCDDFIDECADINVCENRCFVWYDSSLPCQCNDQCQRYGNCCEDYEDSCYPGSCEGNCGTTNSSSACQCNSKCVTSTYDCCGDYKDVCTQPDSCQGLCGMAYLYNRTCQCNTDCGSYGNCCEDYELLCKVPETCEGLCNAPYDPKQSCQCNKACKTHQDCCYDYDDVCTDLYQCKGRCNITMEACGCEEKCVDEKNCCTDYEESCQGGSSWLEEECTKDEDMKCPDGFDTPPVILFSIDGFASSYIHRNHTPNIWKLASCGVHAPYMMSVYPTLTFPNHYTIATGLYPESHGIVANTMYDHEHKEEFRLGSPNAMHPFWWGGEPIWVTTSNQGLKSASYFWVGSDVNITRYPDYYYPFDGSVPNEERIYQGLKWLDMPKEDRPSFITLYMETLDHAGHDVGPDGEEVNLALAEVDGIIGMLMGGLKMRNLDKCVNFILLADHGMANISCDRLTYIDQYGVDMDTVYFRGGAQGRVGKSKDESEWDLFDPVDVDNKLSCQNDTHFQSFLKYEDLPRRYHYGYNARIEDVNLVLDEEWLVGGNTGSYTSCTGGTHGWDNEYKQMRALFLAHGPGFKRGFNSSEGFENIEIYNLIADFLDLNPAPNNGTHGSLYHIMKSPNMLNAEGQGVSPQACQYPSDTDESTDNLGCDICEGEADANRQLDITNEQIDANMLRGIPRVFPSGENEEVKYCVLTQKDYVTAYDWNKKMPYFTAFILDRKIRDFDSNSQSCIRPDIRLDSANSASCSDYENNQSVGQGFLYAPDLSSNMTRSDAEILSNSFPVRTGLEPIWNYFPRVLSNWAALYNGITVVTGPVFDYNFDGLADSTSIINSMGKFLRQGDKTSSPIPTHIFVVATRCRDYESGLSVRACAQSPDDIDVISFLIPNFPNEPCYKDTLTTSDWVSNALYEHVSRLRDVELLTGISFFSDWSANSQNDQDTRLSALRAKLRLPQFCGSWVQDFLENVTPSPDVFETTTQGANSMFATKLTFIVTLFTFIVLKF